MDLLKDNLARVYRHYFWAAFGSALATSVYSVVDVAVVGRYHGPAGLAAMAVIAPVWNIILSVALLSGIGGSILYAVKRGARAAALPANRFFAAALIVGTALSLLVMAALFLCEEPILRFFGADANLLPLAARYLAPVRFSVPLFLLGTTIMAFLRNDGDPGLATLGVLSGGVFNMIGDYVFVFPCNMGIYGAGLATAIGTGISFVVMMSHFLKKKNTLRMVKVQRLGRELRFSSFFVDVAMGILTVLFNQQIMRYLGSDALAVYGPIINVSTFVQCCAYSVGQAAQPILSVNYGAGQGGRIRQTLRLALYTTAFFGLFWTALSLAAPNLYIRIFMDPTPEILTIAPAIIRTYSVSFLLLPLNIFSTYYFQAIMQPRAAFVASVMRGLVISGGLILLLPTAAGAESLWLAMPVTELLTAFYTVGAMRRYTRALSGRK